MKFIVGLGNPGLKYKYTKHNLGYRVVESLAKEAGIKISQKRHKSLMAKGRILGEEVVLLMPQTYMNLSGQAIAEFFREEIKDIDDLVVICDDINMELGKVRLRRQGSSGGHKGLESIIQCMGHDDFARLRIGIATEAHKGDITHYVLSPFRRKELRNVSHVIRLAKDAVICLIKEGIEPAMAKFNKKKAGTS